MISILLPSRGRPQNILRLHESIMSTADQPKDVELVIAIDDDDESMNDMVDNPPVRTTIIKTKPIVLSEYWNLCAKRARGDILMYAADDLIFRTEGWDEVVRDTFAYLPPDKIAFVFPRDGSVHDGKYGTHGWVHRNWFNALGYISPPYFSGDYSDTWINDVARLVNRHIFVDILVEHIHPDFGKAVLDKTYTDKYKRMKRERTAEKYYETEDERHADADKLRKVME